MPGEKEGIPELDLDQVMKDGMEKFDGELQEAAAKESPVPTFKADETASKVASETPKDTSVPPVKPEETKPKAESEKAETPKETGEEKPAPAEKKRLFKDWDEAEERYKELQRNLSRAGEEKQDLVAKLREKEESEALRQKIAVADKDYRTYLKKRMRETTDAIDQLDPESQDYDEKVADLRANEQADIRAYEREHPDVFGVAMSKPASPPPPKETASPAPGESPAMVRVKELITGANVDWTDDDPVFRSYASVAPGKDANGNPIPFDQQVKTAIEQTNAHYEKIVSRRSDAERKKANDEAVRLQGAEMPLGRSGVSGRPGGDIPADQTGIVSLDSALESVRRERTL